MRREENMIEDSQKGGAKDMFKEDKTKKRENIEKFSTPGSPAHDIVGGSSRNRTKQVLVSLLILIFVTSTIITSYWPTHGPGFCSPFKTYTAFFPTQLLLLS